MRAPATPFFRDVPSHSRDAGRDHERFLLDTLAERRAPEPAPAGAAGWVRAAMTRAARFF
ncbi:MAG TPA: hypothetical protein VM370_01050 [Candidatus Thermoplasmatota archaeon]|nr:hypothetical protein [Candidatus Thermoplasmatota archaeon]